MGIAKKYTENILLAEVVRIFTYVCKVRNIKASNRSESVIVSILWNKHLPFSITQYILNLNIASPRESSFYLAVFLELFSAQHPILPTPTPKNIEH